MRRGHLTFTGATGQYFKLLHRLAEFTPLSLTALGPTFRKSGSSFSLAHLEQFYLAWLEIFKMQGKGTFVPWLNESLGLYCPEQCQSTLFSITSPIRKHFFPARFDCCTDSMNRLDIVELPREFSFSGSFMCDNSRSSLGQIFCPYSDVNQDIFSLYFAKTSSVLARFYLKLNSNRIKTSSI